MKKADMAMYHAKEKGKNNYQFYCKKIQSKARDPICIENQLPHALERGELYLGYQARLDFKTGRINGVEALLRWNNPNLGEVPPNQLIPIAEDTGLIIPIGQWVLTTACRQNAAWQQQGLPPVCVSVNLSLQQMIHKDLIAHIESALEASGLAPKYLEVEITESMVMHEPAGIVPIVNQIKAMGVRVAIDDFGTGYATLAQIASFPVDTLKVDRSFIRNIMKCREDQTMAEAMIAMGKSLSLSVVAEGVETPEQSAYLRKQTCDGMQGFYLSKPVAADDFAKLLRRHDASAYR
jgi:EAL domain-containing protein (putative c-di-GMP-specific phosphodiesterase class I)